MVRVNWQGMFEGFAALVMLALGVLYLTLVLVRYFEDRTQARPQFDLRDAARSSGRLAVWLGVKALTFAVRIVAPVFAMLSEASADVGDWFLNLRRHETH